MPDYTYTQLVPHATVTLPRGEGEARLERVRIEGPDGLDTVEIRLSWWKNGKFIRQALDLPEASLMKLLAEGIRKGVLLPAEPH
jgi:hypothetical protein